MSDDLIKRLEEYREFSEGSAGASYEPVDVCVEAADYIKQLKQELSICRMAQVVMGNTVAETENQLAKATEALQKLARLGNGNEYGNSDGNMIARRVLAELEKK